MSLVRLSKKVEETCALHFPNFCSFGKLFEIQVLVETIINQILLYFLSNFGSLSYFSLKIGKWRQ